MTAIRLFPACALVATFGLALGAHGLARAETLTIVIEDIRESKGTIQVEVFAGKAQFDGSDTAVAASFAQAATTGSMTFVAEDLPAGQYAIRIMHDVNGNDELDANFIGIPTEPWGFSNNAKGRFGPPRWNDVRFALEGATTQTIHLVH